SLNRRQDERHSGGYGGDGHNAGPEVDPAGKPAQRLVGKPFGPLVDGPGDREMAGQLREVQGDEGLAQDDERPGPEDGGPSHAKGDRLIGECPCRDADIAERDGEIREESERSPQLRLDAERPKVRVISRDLVGLHGIRGQGSPPLPHTECGLRPRKGMRGYAPPAGAYQQQVPADGLGGSIGSAPGGVNGFAPAAYWRGETISAPSLPCSSS